MNRLTFESDGYFAVSSDNCYGDQNEDYCGPAIDKLAAYEDAEEQGRIISPDGFSNLTIALERLKKYDRWLGLLPCLPGDTVYRILGGCVKQEEVSGYDQGNDYVIKISFKDGGNEFIKNFGKTVFLTREEAEATL